MSKRPQDTSAEEPDGGNPHIRFRGGPELGNRLGLLNRLVFAYISDANNAATHGSGRSRQTGPDR
jgi:hypothetical protein